MYVRNILIQSIGLINLQVVAISVGVVSVAVGIGVPIFYETQIDNAVSSFTFMFFFIFQCWIFKLRHSNVAGQAREYTAMFPVQWVWRT